MSDNSKCRKTYNKHILKENERSSGSIIADEPLNRFLKDRRTRTKKVTFNEFRSPKFGPPDDSPAPASSKCCPPGTRCNKNSSTATLKRTYNPEMDFKNKIAKTFNMDPELEDFKEFVEDMLSFDSRTKIDIPVFEPKSSSDAGGGISKGMFINNPNIVSSKTFDDFASDRDLNAQVF